MDLSLVSFEELIEEMEKRCVCFIAAYEFPKDNKKNATFRYGMGQWYDSVRLSSILNNDVLNNWDGELKTLQRIHEDEP